MSGGATALKFSELAEGNSELEETKKGMEVTIEVAGPTKPITRTVKLTLDSRGLIRLSFKEGGKLPEILQGRFTGISDVKVALSIWKARADKEFKLDESVTAPHSGGGQSVEDLVDEASQKAPPTFDEDLDPALQVNFTDDSE